VALSADRLRHGIARAGEYIGDFIAGNMPYVSKSCRWDHHQTGAIRLFRGPRRLVMLSPRF
jgi:hypothetical protein